MMRFPGEKLRTDLQALGLTPHAAARAAGGVKGIYDWIKGRATPRVTALKRVLDANGISPLPYRDFLVLRSHVTLFCSTCKRTRERQLLGQHRRALKQRTDGVYILTCGACKNRMLAPNGLRSIETSRLVEKLGRRADYVRDAARGGDPAAQDERRRVVADGPKDEILQVERLAGLFGISVEMARRDGHDNSAFLLADHQVHFATWRT